MKLSASRIGLALVLAAVLGYVILRILNMNSKPRNLLGIHNGTLAECPSTPNCVSSFATDEIHAIEPIDVSADTDGAWDHLVNVMGRFPKTRIVESDPEAGYLRCECRTPIVSYVDDVEFLLRKDEQKLHVRSASRLGYSDMNANRNRVESIRKRYKDAMATAE
jgi:uncharacterized protein (DUF1499 family)